MTELALRESFYHDMVKNNVNIQKDILTIIGSENDLTKLNLLHEDKYINGIRADFTLVYDNTIKAIIEVKAADIGVTDYIRGIGQVLQYEYFWDNKISPKGFSYNEKFKSILLIPSNVIKDNSFNVGKFKYPSSTFIVEINEKSEVARKVTKKELNELSNVDDNDLTSISQYYIRDNRLFEIYILLNCLCIQKIKRKTKCIRKNIEKELKKIETINNGNWRNAWISVSSLGLINSNNLPTESGTRIGMLDFEEFAVLMYKSYIKPYIDTILNYFLTNKNNLTNSSQQIIQDLKSLHNDRDVLFLTQSKGRYLSSWLNIMRDDYGILSFKSRSNERTLNYNPLELNERSFTQKIKENSIANQYTCKLKDIL